jgi:uridine kinase
VNQAHLIGISGIDGAGKSYVSTKMEQELIRSGRKAVAIHADRWINLPGKRFSKENPAMHFYLNAIRFDEMLSSFILPLKRQKSIEVEMECAEETSTEYTKHRLSYSDVEIILLEGIYLFKKEYRKLFDLAIWIDCSFETALQRAIARAQEGLSREETIHAYETIYFPAQRIHFEKDHPRENADVIISNEDGRI